MKSVLISMLTSSVSQSLRALTLTLGATARGGVIAFVIVAAVAWPLSMNLVSQVCTWLDASNRQASAPLTTEEHFSFPFQPKGKELKVVRRPPTGGMRPLFELPLLNSADPAWPDGRPQIAELARYEVVDASGKTVLLVALTSVMSPNRAVVRIDAACEVEKGKFRRIKWFESLAPSAEVIVVRRHSLLPALKYVELPTTTGAFSAWLHNKFLGQIRDASPYFKKAYKVTPEHFGDAVGSPLKGMLARDTSSMIWNTGTIGLIIVSDVIQFLSCYLAVLLTLLIAIRWIVLVLAEEVVYRKIAITSPQRPLSVTAPALERQMRFWLGDSGWLLAAIGNGLANERSASSGLVLEPSNRRPATWLAEKLGAGITLTGFIGTLLFLSISLMGAAELIAPDQSQIISALSRFGLLMAGAFTTTLIAAILEYPLMLLLAWQVDFEERHRQRMVGAATSLLSEVARGQIHTPHCDVARPCHRHVPWRLVGRGVRRVSRAIAPYAVAGALGWILLMVVDMCV